MQTLHGGENDDVEVLDGGLIKQGLEGLCAKRYCGRVVVQR